LASFAGKREPRNGALGGTRVFQSALVLSLFNNESSEAEGEADAALLPFEDRLRNRAKDALKAELENAARPSLCHSGAP